MSENNAVTLQNLGGGAVAEKFEQELTKVIQNICNPNTAPAVIREINMKVRIKPKADNREIGDMEVIVTSKLAPTKTLVSRVHVGVGDDGETKAIEVIEKVQVKMFPEEQEGDEKGSNVTKFPTAHSAQG